MHFGKSASQQLAGRVVDFDLNQESPTGEIDGIRRTHEFAFETASGKLRQRQIRFQARLRYLGIDLRNVDVNSQLSGRGNMKQFPGRTATASRIDQLSYIRVPGRDDSIEGCVNSLERLQVLEAPHVGLGGLDDRFL